MDKLTAIQHFLETASSRSFTAAAHRLGTSRSNVSKHVAWLEKELGLQLLRRSTKQVSLTQPGQRMFDKGHAILQLIDDIEHEVRRSVSVTVDRKRTRMNTSHTFATGMQTSDGKTNNNTDH